MYTGSVQVNAVPAVMGVRVGEVVGRFVGLHDSQYLEQFATELLDPSTRPQQ